MKLTALKCVAGVAALSLVLPATFIFPKIPLARAATVNAADFPGGDLGAKINAADANLGSQPGEILVNGGGTIRTRVVLSPDHTLRFGPGTYQITDDPILMKERTQVVGSGRDTILMEPSNNDKWTVIQSYYQFMSNGAGNSNLTIRDLQIKGYPGHRFLSTPGAIDAGDTSRIVVYNVWFNGTHSIGINVGATYIYYQKYASDVWLVKNKFTKVASQNMGIVNARRVTVADNFFENPGQANGPGSAAIDFEPNNNADFSDEVAVLNNFIDARGSELCPAGNYIIFQPFSNPQSGHDAIIAGNRQTALSSKDSSGCLKVANGIQITERAKDVWIYNNELDGCGQNAMWLMGQRFYVYDNKITNCGTGGLQAFEIGGQDMQIFNNTMTVDYLGSTTFYERAPAARNVFYNNQGTKFGKTTTQANMYWLYSGSGSRIATTKPTPPPVKKAANPVITIANNQVTISSNTQYGEVHYTKDGSEPTIVSPLYTGPFPAGGTIKAKTFRAGILNSDVMTYGLGSSPPPPSPTPAPTPTPTRPSPNIRVIRGKVSNQNSHFQPVFRQNSFAFNFNNLRNKL
jgi:Chitobiase/beta-hexosaminidase C-terminal domain